jgi:outer membrane PBP1 activator LpoA protein
MKTPNIFVALYFVLFISFLVSCSQQTNLQKQEQKNLPESAKQTIYDANLLLNTAEKTVGAERHKLLIQAAYILIKNKQFTQADEILSEIESDSLNTNWKAIYFTQRAELLLQQQQSTRSIKLLNDNITPGLLNIEGQILFSQVLAKSLFQSSQYINSIKERIFINPILLPDEKESNNQLIWDSISLLSIDELEVASQKETDENLLGWIKLSYISKAYQYDLEIQNEKLDEWLANNVDHDANEFLPETLKQIKKALKNRPENLAILLPESGPFAKSSNAIKRGILNNYYRALNSNSFTPIIKFYNTSDESLELLANSSPIDSSESFKAVANDDEITETPEQKEINKQQIKLTKNNQGFLTIYAKAINDGADLIIGPINKNYIDLLKTEDIKTIPTLTLNYSGKNNQNSNNEIFQFGLAPEDEVNFITKQAQLREYKNAAILAPEGTWGERLKQAFRSAWETRGGEIVTEAEYQNTRELTKVIEVMLNIDKSEQRFKRLYWYSGGEALFYSRRREDIDFIFLISSPDMGRQIMPTFVFHNAENIPVFSSSSVYSGEYNIKDKDLDGLIFSDLPAIINNNKVMTEAWNQQDPRYKRLIAMGMDAYDLSVRLNILKSSENNEMHGKTGTLHMLNDQRIIRDPTLAKFYGSKAKPIPIIFEKRY